MLRNALEQKAWGLDVDIKRGTPPPPESIYVYFTERKNTDICFV